MVFCFLVSPKKTQFLFLSICLNVFFCFDVGISDFPHDFEFCDHKTYYALHLALLLLIVLLRFYYFSYQVQANILPMLRTLASCYLQFIFSYSNTTTQKLLQKDLPCDYNSTKTTITFVVLCISNVSY